MAGSTKPCLFCGNVGVQLTVEDVYPVWLRKALHLRGPMTFWQGSPGKIIRVTKTLSVKLGGICADCNNGWMSGLENDVKTLFTSAFNGTATGLSQPGQQTIALWATKMALLLDLSLFYVRGETFAPLPHFRWIFEKRTPPPTTRVWLGAVRDVGGNPAWSHIGVRDRPEEGPAYLAAFTIGHVLFQVLGLEDPAIWPIGDRRIEPPLGDGDYLIRFWPDNLPLVIWPPPIYFPTIASLESVWHSA